jgi:hypothetical protein
MGSGMKVIFNVDKERFEVHDFNFVESTLLVASFIAGVSFWIVAVTILLDPSYQ